MPLRRATRSAVLVIAMLAIWIGGSSTDPGGSTDQAGRRWWDGAQGSGPSLASTAAPATVAAIDRDGRRWR